MDETQRTVEPVWVVADPDHPTTPIGGVWTSLKAATEHCPMDYVVIKIDLDISYLRAIEHE